MISARGQWSPLPASYYQSSFCWTCGNGKDTSLTMFQHSSPSNSLSLADICNSSACAGTLAWASNYSAGAGDFLSFGLTIPARKAISWLNGNGYGDAANYQSGAYITGAVTGAAIQTAFGATGGAIANGKNGALFGRGGAFFNRGPIRFGWSWEGSAKAGRDVIRLGIGAARGTSWWSHIPFYYP